MPNPVLQLKDFTFTELFRSEGLNRLDQTFLDYLEQQDPVTLTSLLDYRHEKRPFTTLEISELLLAVAKPFETFLIALFAIEEEAALLQAKTLAYHPISAFKHYFVLRRAKKHVSRHAQLPSFMELDTWLTEALKQAPFHSSDKELAVALLATHYIAEPEQYAEQTEKLTYWCTQALATEEGKAATKGWVSLELPKRIEHNHLVNCVDSHDKLHRLANSPDMELRQRDGFVLTDSRMNAKAIQDQVNYCIYCHDHDGDFCSKGFPVKKGDPAQGLKKNPLDITLTGCPLEEKISEMNLLKRDGFTLASLAMVMVDNPMCPATGHRICNDCMKACIYQKQDPVNIPQIETRVLTDVLSLPWGVEIYDLLTRWNPLRQKQWIMKPYNGLKVMIAGMGPAGFTLAHHLLLEGFAVVGFDGLKIEPLPTRFIEEPIYQFNSLIESLDERLMVGFGGVAEYGITVRWDKNFLKLIYISLMRKPHFQVFGSTRFGGTMTVEQAWELGFDHFVIAVGAGLPKALSIPGSLAPGMRQANDFLMALQLGNAAKTSSLTNLQIRLPAVVIGGGLTGVDTATEVQAYYIKQVEKTLSRYETLVSALGEETILSQLDPASKEILDEYLTHGKAIRKERDNALAEKRSPNFIQFIHQWGGVTIVYRRFMQDSPAYIHNHEELQKALEEGVYYVEAMEPSAIDLNQYGHVETLICHRRIHRTANEWETTTEAIRIPARSIFAATGTQPNIAYEFEHRGTFTRLGLQYQHYEEVNHQLITPHGVSHCKDPLFGPFTSYHKNNHRVSLIGDTHPVFHGSVVKAIASGLRTYPKILHVLKNQLGNLGDLAEYQQFAEKMTHLFTAKITKIERCTPTTIKLRIQAPLAIKHFQPGQFYRLQNYETFAKQILHTTLQMEPLALLAARVHPKEEALDFIIIENGTSAKLCATLNIGDPVSLMGPTGVRAKMTHEHETVFIIGTELSIPLLTSYGHALRQKGNRVVYIGWFESKDQLFDRELLEASADVIIWVTKTGELIKPSRTVDYSIQSDSIRSVLFDYAREQLSQSIRLADADRLYVVGNSDLLRDIQEARKNELKDYLLKNPRLLGSVYSTMQCMLKGVCAQCLQWQIDPETGKRTKAVFACSWQNQPLELIDFDNLEERQAQNTLQETLSSLWLDYIFSKSDIARH